MDHFDLSDISKSLPIYLHLHEPGLKMWRHRGETGRLVICLSGVGNHPAKEQGYDMPRAASGHGRDHVLFIADTNRSWLNAPGLIESIQAEVSRIVLEDRIEEICTLGHSMGGFAALALPGLLRQKISSAIALAPQVSVHPDIAGDDPRWMEHRDRIASYRVPYACADLQAETQYFVLHGGKPRDAAQRDRVPVASNLTHLILPGTAHNVPGRMKRFGLLDAVVKRLVAGRGDQALVLLRALGAAPRNLERFPMRMASSERDAVNETQTGLRATA